MGGQEKSGSSTKVTAKCCSWDGITPCNGTGNYCLARKQLNSFLEKDEGFLVDKVISFSSVPLQQ